MAQSKETKLKEDNQSTPFEVHPKSMVKPKIVSLIQPKIKPYTPLGNPKKEVTTNTSVTTQLPQEVQAKMENSFGQDFSNINIHKDSSSAKDINAKAYTQGTDVHFAPSEYNPTSKEGQELIGHELTHVVQQGQGKVGSGEIHGKGLTINQNPTLEKEADDAGKLASEGKSIIISNSIDDGAIQRKIDPKKALEVAIAVYTEIDGLGSSKDDIIELLIPYKFDGESMSLIKSEYRKQYGYSMDAHIMGDFDGKELESILEVTKISDSYNYNKVLVGTDNSSVVTTSGTYSKATTFLELIRLVRIAEDKLINAGHNDITDRIRIIRGIYYGTSWSMDFSKEKSETRNLGFDAYTASTDRPFNPINIIGEALFKALRDTPELKDGARSLDFGHLMIGLESRSSYTSREIELPDQLGGGTGLEDVTWLGDLGGGAGMVAIKRIVNNQVKTKDIVFNGAGHDYGALINLEGDIAAYVIAKDDKEADGPSYPQMKKYGYISDSVADYLLTKSGKTTKEYNERVSNFAKMIGAKIEKGIIINKSDMITQMTSKLVNFGGLYAVVRMKNSGMATESNYIEASKHIKGASKEVAEIFIDMLDRSIKDPSKSILAVLNPQPSAKGEPYGILKQTADAMRLTKSMEKNTKDLQKRILEWMK